MSMTQSKLDGEAAIDRSDSDEYGTPVSLIERFQRYLPGGLFDLDAAAGAEATQISRWRLTKADDALADDTDWLAPTPETNRGDVDSIFLNPPFSDPYPFIRRFIEAIDPDDPEKASFGVTITRADTTTDYFHDFLSNATLFMRDDRESFVGAGDDANFACIIGLFGDPPEGLLEDLSDDGQFYERQTIDELTEQSGLNEFGVAPDTPFVQMDRYDNPFEEARRRHTERIS
jgi:hypothetical protein